MDKRSEAKPAQITKITQIPINPRNSARHKLFATLKKIIRHKNKRCNPKDDPVYHQFANVGGGKRYSPRYDRLRSHIRTKWLLHILDYLYWRWGLRQTRRLFRRLYQDNELVNTLQIPTGPPPVVDYPEKPKS